MKVPLEFELLPPTGPPTPTGDVVVPDTFEKSELRSKLVSWSLPGMLDPGTVTGVGLTSSLLGVRVGVVSIWFITSGKEEGSFFVKTQRQDENQYHLQDTCILCMLLNNDIDIQKALRRLDFF